MIAKKKRTGAQAPRKKALMRRRTAPKARKLSRGDVPRLFRLSLEVGNLDAGAEFYAKLLGAPGRRLPGSRCYFRAGPVTLSVLDVSSVRQPHPAAKALYFTVKNLEAAFDRAKSLGCLSREDVHDAAGGGIVVRPWGERSFYVEDPWKNPLCFVQEGTVYTG